MTNCEAPIADYATRFCGDPAPRTVQVEGATYAACDHHANLINKARQAANEPRQTKLVCTRCGTKFPAHTGDYAAHSCIGAGS